MAAQKLFGKKNLHHKLSYTTKCVQVAIYWGVASYWVLYPITFSNFYRQTLIRWKHWVGHLKQVLICLGRKITVSLLLEVVHDLVVLVVIDGQVHLRVMKISPNDSQGQET